jgi:hypothetical protein
MAPDPSWRQIAPGVWDDNEGGLHIDAPEILRANGYEDNAENQAALERAAAQLAADQGLDYEATE